MRRSIISAFISFVIGCSSAYAQDYNLNSHNLVPFSLNPAQAGNANAIRLGLDFRQQWPKLDNRYTTVRLSYDQNVYKKMCSLGFAYSLDDQSSVYRSNEFSLVYSHTFEVTELSFIRLGLQGTYYLNYFGFDKLEYGDQYDSSNGHVDNSTIEDFETNTRGLFDFSFGAVYYVENTFSLGASVFHIAEPENGFVRKADNKLARKYVVHANYMHDLQYTNGLWGRRDMSDNYLFVNANYQQQADFKKAYLGLGVFLTPVILGVAEKYNLDGVFVTSLMAGCSIKGLQAYYVFDLPTYERENGAWSHEICLVYVIKQKERFPCPMVLW
ncbi:MAG: PorP/SprF family type IX secretion system membrane protein [Paludibacteraceae bacterium]|nr:PorP/SprF family type IX secretion system membrane protein [Paludibacteraceae bacterium]MCR5569113.1 PorP/SprF family type IX secretion system membrane protein [Paludibacteraceae bacterium]